MLYTNRKKAMRHRRKYGRALSAVLCGMLSIALVITMMPPVFAATGPEGASGEDGAVRDEAVQNEATQNELALEEGTFAPGEVIVSFKAGEVKDQDTSLKKAQKMTNVDSDFGETARATGEAKEAAQDAPSEVRILRSSLGDDFVIEDSVAIDEDLIVCLVSSDRYDTKTMIEKLSGNPDVKSVEANSYIEKKSFDYSLNDALNQYAYQTNSPADKNSAGKDVSARGADPAKTLSPRTASVVDFAADHSQDDEVVVAVTDSGVNYKHEDLKDMMWTNPGNIGLEGEHGFNFEDNAADVWDTEGHGTHCSGIIAAQANNAKGVAGVASGVNVKIMMVSTSTADRESESDGKSTAYRSIGALNYVLKAKQRGVNVVATSNSWGTPGDSPIYDEIFDRLGKAGVISFVAASNDAIDIDRYHYSPPGGDSPYMVVVGSANVNGKPSAFTDYGKAYVDIFAPGHTILSTSAMSEYEPNLYTAEKRAENTEYYGQFNSTMQAGDKLPDLATNEIVPDTAGEGVKAFGAAKFFQQSAAVETQIEEGEVTDTGVDAPQAVCDLSVATDRTFTDNYAAGSDKKPASLKVTIKNARYDGRYYLYFPYAKNHATTGIDNTRYSIYVMTQHEPDEFSAQIEGGEVVKYEKDGNTYCKMFAGGYVESRDNERDDVTNITRNSDRNNESLLSWKDADPDTTDVTETGLGIRIKPQSGSDEEEGDEISPDTTGDITVYIDSAGISKPVTEEGKTPEDVFPAESSYKLMSGTSMATPAAAGAYAVMSALHPKKKGQTGSEYALENRARYLSLARETDELRDLCSSGGYIDLSLMSDTSRAAVTDAVCNVGKETLSLHGINLKKGLKLSYKSLAQKGAKEKALPSGAMKVSYASDGKTVTINSAKPLFGRYTEFIFRDSKGKVCARGSFFLVKGQKKLKKILTEEHKEMFDTDATLPLRYLLTDASGKAVYAYQLNSNNLYEKTAGTLMKFDGNKFVTYQGTSLKESVFAYYEALGYDRHQLTRGLEVTPWIVRQPICEGNKLYDFVDVTYSPSSEAGEEDIEHHTYLATMDFAAAKPKWTFKETNSLRNALKDIKELSVEGHMFCAYKGKIYCFGTPGRYADPDTGERQDPSEVRYTFVCSLDPGTGKWKREKDFKDAALGEGYAFVNNGKIYVMKGNRDYIDSSCEVYTYDTKTWKRMKDIPFIGRSSGKNSPVQFAAAPVKEGFVFFNYSTEGAGNVFLYNTSTGKCEPMYYTVGDSFSDPSSDEGAQSAVETKDGLFYTQKVQDSGMVNRVELYQIPKSSGAYATRYKDANTAKIKTKNRTVKYKKLKKLKKKKKLTYKVVYVSNAKGAVSYIRSKITCKKKRLKTAKKKIKISAKTGKVSIRKGLKKGKYTVYVKVQVKGNSLYKPLTKTVKFRLTVK